jgi:hypothetical protein
MKKSPSNQKRTHFKILIVSVFACSVFLVLSSWNNAKNNPSESLLAYKSFNFFPSDAYNVPHDVQSPKDSGQVALSQFAWQEFIALNWPSSYDTITHTRGKPDTSKSAMDFLSPDNSGQLVWQTYKHRVEMYPVMESKFDTTFNNAPQYFYKVGKQESITSLDPTSTKKLSDVRTIFNNLDETSELNLCAVFVDGDPDSPGATSSNISKTASGLPGAPRRMIYEAKGNQDMFEYVSKNNLYKSKTRSKKIANTGVAIRTLEKGAVYLPNPDSNTIVFPFGDNNGVEGSIEVKATWRQLTLKEYNSGRYLTAPILYYRSKVNDSNPKDTITYYDIVPAFPTKKTLPYGLVGLHIIHKTVNFPSYVFATFEQVDNLSTTIEPKNTLFYYNRNSNPAVNPNKQYAYRANPILPGTKQVNTDAHNQIKAKNSKSVWQYYKLIGVQGHPQNNANTTDYFLSNIVTETNQTLRDFSGSLDNTNGTFNPTETNVYQGKKKFVQGGCKGCHGNAQDADFSFVTKDAPFGGVPDVINLPLLKKKK